MKPLPPPTDEEREKAREAAAALRAAMADPRLMGELSGMHVYYGGGRGEFLFAWTGLPGLLRHGRKGPNARYSHGLLPGWEYTRAEIRAELIPDLEALAERGERPTVATSGAR